MRPVALVISCEHGGNRVPAALQRHFVGAARILASHRGWDAGALQLARRLARRCDAPLFPATVSRLVVDLNRSPDHPRVFSEWTRGLGGDARAGLLARLHAPHRDAVAAAIARAVSLRRRAFHVAVHSFVPVLDGVRRDVDLGLLYDPARACERALARGWATLLREELPELRVRMNRPYRGTSDGLTTALRRRFADADYAGIELEVNQRLLAPRARWARICAGIERALARSHTIVDTRSSRPR